MDRYVLEIRLKVVQRTGHAGTRRGAAMDAESFNNTQGFQSDKRKVEDSLHEVRG